MYIKKARFFHIFMCDVTREYDSAVDHDLIAVAKDRSLYTWVTYIVTLGAQAPSEESHGEYTQLSLLFSH